MGEVGKPTLQRGLEGSEICCCGLGREILELAAVAFPGLVKVLAADAGMVGQDAITDEVCTPLSFCNLAFDGVDFDPKGG